MDNFSFLDLIWTILLVYALFVVIMMLASIVADLFLDRGLSGWAKAGWIVLLFALPLLGILIYVVARHDGMVERASRRREAQVEQFEGRVREAGAAQQIADAKGLLDHGAISRDEYEVLKAKALA